MGGGELVFYSVSELGVLIVAGPSRMGFYLGSLPELSHTTTLWGPM